MRKKETEGRESKYKKEKEWKEREIRKKWEIYI